jgi:hypothetical protein
MKTIILTRSDNVFWYPQKKCRSCKQNDTDPGRLLQPHVMSFCLSSPAFNKFDFDEKIECEKKTFENQL